MQSESGVKLERFTGVVDVPTSQSTYQESDIQVAVPLGSVGDLLNCRDLRSESDWVYINKYSLAEENSAF